MAVNDIINDVVSQNNNSSNYQPAAGVEVEIRFAMCIDATNGRIRFTDGTNTTTFINGTGMQNQIGSYKLGITNTNYIELASIAAVAVVLAYSGIQVK